MLVLTRKLNQSIMIGNDVKIMVLSVHGQRVKLGIEAESDQVIRRQECLTGSIRNGALAAVPGQN